MKFEWFGSFSSAKGVTIKELYIRAFHDPFYVIVLSVAILLLILIVLGVI